MRKKMEDMNAAEMVDIAFGSFDRDGDKKIGQDDLMAIMTEMGERVTPEEVAELIRIADQVSTVVLYA